MTADSIMEYIYVLPIILSILILAAWGLIKFIMSIIVDKTPNSIKNKK